MRGRTFIFGGILALLGFAAASASLASSKYEEPRYSVKLHEGNREVREYPETITAEVTVQSAAPKAADEAFRILAGYIFGKNKSRQKIAMTVPVTEQIRSEKIAMTVPVTTETAEAGMRMSFFMPAQYSLESLPEPMDKRIKFSTLPPRTYAVIRFSGLARESSIQQQTSALLRFMHENKLIADGQPIRAFFNPPWTLPFLRRNEIWCPVKRAA